MDSDGADGIASEVIADDTDAPVAIEIARTDARRLEAFSDGVFAIAMTLLVLNLSITKGLTDGDVWSAISDQREELVSAAISFIVIGLYWIVHRSTFDRIVADDGALTVANFVHLASVVFLPFPTLVLAEYGGSSAGVILYAIALALVGYSAAVVTWVAWHNHLLRADVPREWMVTRVTGLMTTPTVFLLTIPIAVFNPAVAMWFWLVAFIVPKPVDLVVARLQR